MKKARIFLAAIAIIAFIGGTLAFKNAARTGVNFYTTTTSTGTVPAANFYGVAITTTTTVGTIFKYYTTVAGGTPSSVKYNIEKSE